MTRLRGPRDSRHYGMHGWISDTTGVCIRLDRVTKLLFGFMSTAPLGANCYALRPYIGVVPKPHPDKFRLVNDLSTGPHAPNSWISCFDSSV